MKLQIAIIPFMGLEVVHIPESNDTGPASINRRPLQQLTVSSRPKNV